MGATPRLLLALTAVVACCAVVLPSSAAAATSTTSKTQYFKNACGGSITPSTQPISSSAVFQPVASSSVAEGVGINTSTSVFSSNWTGSVGLKTPSS